MDYFKRKKIKDILYNNISREEYQDIVVLGWVRTKRVSKNIAFIELNDGSTLHNLQIVFLESEKFPLDNISTGTSLRVKGYLEESEGREQSLELKAEELTIIGDAPADYLLQKKRHSFEFLREIAHLRPRTNTFGVINRFRSKLANVIHSYFQSRGFYYIHSPIITTSDAEGAGDLFQVTTLDLNNLPLSEDGSVDYSSDFFGVKAGLTVSGQLEAEVLATALGDVYTFGPTFRAENSNTSRHASEFWMVEPEMAFCELDEMMDIIEDFLKYLFRYSLEEAKEEMAFFNKWIDNERIKILEDIISADFERITYTEAVKSWKKLMQSSSIPLSGVLIYSQNMKDI